MLEAFQLFVWQTLVFSWVLEGNSIGLETKSTVISLVLVEGTNARGVLCGLERKPTVISLLWVERTNARGGVLGLTLVLTWVLFRGEIRKFDRIEEKQGSQMVTSGNRKGIIKS